MMIFKRPYEECLRLGYSKDAIDEVIAFSDLTQGMTG